MFGPLSFSEQNEVENNSSIKPNEESLFCLLCTQEFSVQKNNFDFINHLYDKHEMKIDRVDEISDFESYINYWREHFSTQSFREICPYMSCESSELDVPSSSRGYFLLGPNIEEDFHLRESLQRKRLDSVIQQQTLERNDDNFSRLCLFCKSVLQGSRFQYLNHLARKHNFHMGHPQNLVFIDELLDKVNSKLQSLQCIYCERIFKNRGVLREHMRKKQHRRINPKNTEYDKYYIINYLELGKDWKEFQADSLSSDDEHSIDSDASDWSDWNESEGMLVVCLFCDFQCKSFEDVLNHMVNIHTFNYEDICLKKGLNFYKQVKLVNYIRKQIYSKYCIFCDMKFENNSHLLSHMASVNHFKIPEANVWEQPEFYFPTYENDSFLCFLDDLCDNVAGISETMKSFGVQET